MHTKMHCKSLYQLLELQNRYKRDPPLEWSLSSSLTKLVYLIVEVYLHYYLRYNYMFRLLTIAIFRFYMNP